MVYLEGATEAQISAALGIKPVTVRDWKKRSEWSDAVAALREYQQNLVLDRLSLLSSKAADAIEDSLDSVVLLRKSGEHLLKQEVFYGTRN